MVGVCLTDITSEIWIELGKWNLFLSLIFELSDKRIDSKVSFKKKKKKRIDTKLNEVVQRAQVISYQ